MEEDKKTREGRKKVIYTRASQDNTGAIVQGNDKMEYEYHNLGNDYYKLGDFQKAVEHYSRAIELKPDMLESYFNRGLAYTRMHDFGRAINDHSSVIRLDPELVEAYYTRGLLYEYMKDYESAIGDYNKVLSLKPDYHEVREQREMALRKKLSG